MSLKATVKNIETIEESSRTLYREQGEGDAKRYVLDVEGVDGYALEDVQGLKSALGTKTEELRKSKEVVTAFGEVKPSDVATMATRIAELEAIDPNTEAGKLADEKFKAMEKTLKEAHAKELDTRTERITFLTGKVREYLVDNVATDALQKARGSVSLLLPHVTKNVRVREANNDFVVEILDATGNPRVIDGQGTPMSIEAMIVEMKASDVFAPAFEGSGASGSGSRAGDHGQGGSTAQPKHRSDFTNDADKAAWINKNGYKKFTELPAPPTA